jgi:hypothetical protein
MPAMMGILFFLMAETVEEAVAVEYPVLVDVRVLVVTVDV